jgi:hypothetical protein
MHSFWILLGLVPRVFLLSFGPMNSDPVLGYLRRTFGLFGSFRIRREIDFGTFLWSDYLEFTFGVSVSRGEVNR